MRRVLTGIAVAVALVAPASAKDEPFGQETVEVRPFRNPPKTGAAGTHRHGHDHGPAARKGGHSHDEKAYPGHKHKPAGGGARHDHGHGAKHGHDQHGHDQHGHAHGVETEHLFGFTTGTDIDEPGAKHVISDFGGRFGKGSGTYAALSQRFEYAFTPWRNFHVGLGASVAYHHIAGVDGLDDRNQGRFDALSIEFRQRLLERQTAPFGLTLIAEPHWGRVDETTGEPADKIATEFTLAADKELVKDRLYAAVNLVYEPEWVRSRVTGEVERESTVAVSLAAMTPIMFPKLLVGGEVRYARAYEGAALERFAGEAVFAGPTVFAMINDSVLMIAAYSTQLAGRAAGGSGSLDLENFERHRAKLKFVFHF